MWAYLCEYDHITILNVDVLKKIVRYETLDEMKMEM